jgi:hypothetical protein
MPQVEGNILQLDEYGNIIKAWTSSQQIAQELDPNRVLNYQAFDQALKKGYKSHGSFWMFKADYEAGERPNIVRQIRNVIVFAYKLKKELRRHQYNDETVEINLFEDCEFVGKFKNAVHCGVFLDVSISNIRCVLKRNNKRIHRGFFFSYFPLRIEENNVEFSEPNEREIKTYRRNQKHYLQNRLL